MSENVNNDFRNELKKKSQPNPESGKGLSCPHKMNNQILSSIS